MWAGTTIADKIILDKWIKSSSAYMMIYGFIQLFPLLGLPFLGLQLPGLGQLAIALFAGGFAFYGYVLYGKALSLEEASRVAPLFQFGPMFTLVFAYFFLGEHLGCVELAAFTMLVIGGFLVSVKRAKGVLSLSPALTLMMIATLFFAASATLTKYVFMQQGFWDGFVLMRIGFFAGTLSLLSFNRFRSGMLLSARSLSNRARGFVIANSILDVSAVVAWNYAASQGPVSLVHALVGVTPLFVFFLALGFSRWAPRVLREETTPKIVLLKLFATALIIAGVAVLAVT
jgi:drug/metabolite transporter (DMT)-like permease